MFSSVLNIRFEIRTVTNKNKLKQIIFGCKADETNIKKIIQLCQLNGFEHIVFKKARIVSGKFELDFDEIDKSQYL